MNKPSPAEIELLAALDGQIKSGKLSYTYDIDPILVALEEAFPIPDTRLEWTHVPDRVSVAKPQGEDRADAFVAFMRKIVAQERLTGTVYVVGDGPVLFVFSGDINEVIEALPAVLEFPQHTYIYPYPAVTWCASYAMEGWMDFAWRQAT